MRFGILVPMSSDSFSLAVVIAIIGVAIYAIYYAVTESSRKNQVKNLQNEFSKNTTVAENVFGFPAGSSEVFPVKHYNDRFGFATQRTSGTVGFAMCTHSQLSFHRLYAFVDYSNRGPIQALIYLISENPCDKKIMLKITPESSMFSHDAVRYYSFSDGPANEIPDNYHRIEVNSKIEELTQINIDAIYDFSRNALVSKI